MGGSKHSLGTAAEGWTGWGTWGFGCGEVSELTRRAGRTAGLGCSWVVGGLLSGVKGFAAFWAVLVCLPGCGGGSSLELLLVTCLLPLARGWVLGQVVTGGLVSSW